MERKERGHDITFYRNVYYVIPCSELLGIKLEYQQASYL